MTILLLRLGPIARTSAIRSQPIRMYCEPRPRLYSRLWCLHRGVVATRDLSIRAVLRRCHWSGSRLGAGALV